MAKTLRANDRLLATLDNGASENVAPPCGASFGSSPKSSKVAKSRLGPRRRRDAARRPASHRRNRAEFATNIKVRESRKTGTTSDNARMFAARMGLQAYALAAAAQGAVDAYAHVTGEDWKAYEPPAAAPSSVSRKSSAEEIAAFG